MGSQTDIQRLQTGRRRYFVVYGGFLYIYKSETDNKPVKVIDLCAFQRVERDEDLKAKGVVWPLKITSDIPNVKFLHFGAISEQELIKWIEVVKKGIEEAKESGRKPVTVEKKMTNRPAPKKRQPRHSDEDDDKSDGSDYTSIDDQEAGSENDSSPDEKPTKPDKPNKTKPSVISPADEDLQPQPSNKNHGHAKGNHTSRKPVAASRSSSQSDPTDSKPAVPSANIPHTETRKPPPQKKKPDSNLVKKQPSKEPEAVDLISEATWTGSPEEANETMRSIDEDGIFMLRESTAGNGELTLQVISDDAVRKYRITKEGKQFRMAGGSTFDSIAELLSFYQNNSIPNHSTKLTKPYSKV